MPQMPDKEFDQLFKGHFADAEIAPSRDLWANIEEKLAPKRKRVFPVYWAAAATIAVAFTAMLVFQKEEKIQLRGNDNVVAQNLPSVIKVTAAEVSVNPDAATTVKGKTTKTKSAPITIKAVNKAVEKELIENNLQNFSIAMQPIEETKHLPIKQTAVKPLDVLPKEEVITDSQIIYANAEVKKDLSSNVIGETETIERKGIRNIGDLVNLVVDKVDKRENKIIKFNTDDDDNSSIVGINIGILKFNKKK